ncbi:MAG: hypothetical protein PVJ57_05850 [Phycisphaerae bacterium]|jgi:hypothetical protein
MALGSRIVGSWPRLWLGVASLVVAAVIWLPLVHYLFRCDPAEYRSVADVPPRAVKLAARHVRLWDDPAQRRRATDVLRACNPEWDLMSRGYLVLSLANMSLREPARQEADLATIDQIIDDTLAAEREHGHGHFLLPYAHARPFVLRPARSQHVDSQIGLMLAARCVLKRSESYGELLRERVEIMQQRMEASPVLAAESYPDECWMYDNVNALAVMRLSDVLFGTDHADFLKRWREVAPPRLSDPGSKLLISSFTCSGTALDGPEGSTIWMVAHALQLVDADLAREQYRLARRELSRTLLGFGYAREWPDSWVGPADVDSGPPIPGLGVSAGSSGTALIAASAFDDTVYLAELFTTLDFAGFPQEDERTLRYCASNELGDAVTLYATVLGPLWDWALSEGRP